jgi:2,3-bisphosphoglycerate-independent phosphoglycerate mutase
MEAIFPDSVVVTNESKIVFLIIDGLGGLAMEGKGGTELQVARTPNLDDLAARSICGLLDPVAPGITPGSGPAHLALFGYDPVKWNIGRGVLEAFGIDFPLQENDVAARGNFATFDAEGKIVDRRAGRISTEMNQGLCAKVRERVDLAPQAEYYFEPVRDYRVVLVLRGEGLHDDLTDTDPQALGVEPLACQATDPRAEETAELVNRFLSQAQEVLAREERANGILLRGFAKYRRYPSMEERFGLKCLAIANYPMYRGLARLVGMELHPVGKDMRGEFAALSERYREFDYFFLHVKEPDSRGEDGNFDAKVRILEEIDGLVPWILALKPDVLVVTGDHSTPTKLRSHSWHPLPVLLHSTYARVDEVERFDEVSCARGSLGRMPMVNLMSLALAHALRLTKYGA